MSGKYPANWNAIALSVKEYAGNRCIRCGHHHETKNHKVKCDEMCDKRYHIDNYKQRILTVHHLDKDKSNCEWWNLSALCQVCHLQIQSKVNMNQDYMLDHSNWFKPYLVGFYAYKAGLRLTKRMATEMLMQNENANLIFQRTMSVRHPEAQTFKDKCTLCGFKWVQIENLDGGELFTGVCVMCDHLKVATGNTLRKRRLKPKNLPVGSEL